MSETATPATQNDRTTCLETFEKVRFPSFPHRHGDATGQPETRNETRGCKKNEHFVRYFLQFRHFPHVITQVGMSETATSATQNDRTTCVETFEKDRFASFPHRHGDATGKPETRNETRGCKKRAFRAILPPIFTFSTHYQTGWTVTKCHACHAKRQDNLLGNIRKGYVFQLPP